MSEETWNPTGNRKVYMDPRMVWCTKFLTYGLTLSKESEECTWRFLKSKPKQNAKISNTTVTLQ